MTEPTIKPCPFCGTSGPGLYVTSNAHDAPFVECNDCGSCGPVESTEAEAIESWNRRAEPQELAMMVRSLLQSLELYDPIHPKIDRYKDYLSRHGLQGTPLREPEA